MSDRFRRVTGLVGPFAVAVLVGASRAIEEHERKQDQKGNTMVVTVAAADEIDPESIRADHDDLQDLRDWR